jgi:hypothetical protein
MKKFQLTFLSTGPIVRTPVYLNVDHAHDLITTRSITGLLFLSELVAPRISISSNYSLDIYALFLRINIRWASLDGR